VKSSSTYGVVRGDALWRVRHHHDTICNSNSASDAFSWASISNGKQGTADTSLSKIVDSRGPIERSTSAFAHQILLLVSNRTTRLSSHSDEDNYVDLVVHIFQAVPVA